MTVSVEGLGVLVTGWFVALLFFASWRVAAAQIEGYLALYREERAACRLAQRQTLEALNQRDAVQAKLDSQAEFIAEVLAGERRGT